MSARAWDFVGEGRRHSRWDVDGHADIVGHELLLYQPIDDISMGGIRIQTGSPETVGRRVRVTLTSPGSLTPVEVEGNIVWNDSYPSCEVGVRFDLDRTKQTELSEYIALSRKRRLSVADEDIAV